MPVRKVVFSFEDMENEVAEECYEIYKKYRKRLKYLKKSKVTFLNHLNHGVANVSDMVFLDKQGDECE